MFPTKVQKIAPLFLVALLVASIAYAAYTNSTDAIYAKFTELENQYTLPKGYLGVVAQAESGMNAKAGNPARAYGLFQWFPSSWTSFTRQAYGTALDPDTRSDPYLAAEVTALRAKGAWNKFKGTIEQAKIDPKLGLYMEHFLGPGDFPKFMTGYMQDPNGRAADVVPKAAQYNAPVFKNGSATFTDVLNNRAKAISVSGVVSLTGYKTAFADASQRGRILDEQSTENLQREYKGPPLPPDPIPVSPTDYGMKETRSVSDQQHAAQQCPTTTFCNGYALMRQDTSCNTTLVQTCEFGCVSDSQCAVQQNCPSGSVMQNGQCTRLQGQQSQQSSPLNSAFSPSQSGGGTTPQNTAGAFPSSNGNTIGAGTGGLSGIPNSPASFNAISTMLDPQGTLLPKIATGTPAYELIVAISGSRPATLTGSPPETAPHSDQTPTTVPTTIVSPVFGQLTPSTSITGNGQGIQTFTSTDLSDDTRTFAPTQNTGFLSSILSNVKNILLRILAFITPR